MDLRIHIKINLTKKLLGKKYDISRVHSFIKETEEIKLELNYLIYLLLEDTIYLSDAFNEVQKLANNLEPDVAAKFLSYPIPKAIGEEWEKVK